jgi:hypothetical protein
MQNILTVDNNKNIFFGAMTIIGLCVCMYIYMVTVTIRNIVTAKNISSEVSNMSEKISSKEFAFIDLQNKVTMNYAKSLGFAEAKQKVFITPRSVSFVAANTSAI